MGREELYKIIGSRLPNSGFEELSFHKDLNRKLWLAKKWLILPQYFGKSREEEKIFSSVAIEGNGVEALVAIDYARGNYDKSDIGIATHHSRYLMRYDFKLEFYAGNKHFITGGVKLNDCCQILDFDGRIQTDSFSIPAEVTDWQYALRCLLDELNQKVR